MRVRTRRRWLTPRVLIAVAVVAAVGVPVAVFIGHAHQAAGTPVADVPTSVACHVDTHSVEGAAVTVIDGIHQLALANLGPVDATPDHAASVEATLERYLTPERRPLMRQYLKAYPATFVTITSTVLAWQPVSYDEHTAVIRIATTDTATTAAGEQKASQAVTSVTLTFDAAQGFWRLADWKVGGGVNVADVVAGGRQVPCA